MSDTSALLKQVSEEEGIAWLTLNRPERKNALSKALMAEIIDCLKELRENDKIRCIITTGAGDSFCSGLDLYDLRDSWKRKRRWEEGGTAREIITILRSCPQVTIAAVKGYCLGGGLVLLNGHDLAFAADTAKIGMPEVLRGSYGAIATPTLFQAGIPMKKAFYIQLSSENLTAEEAEKLGLVSKVVPEKQLMESVNKFAREIASRDPVTLEHAKIAAYMARDLDFNKALQVDDLVSHRQKFYTNPLNDVEEYLRSQKGGANLGYVKPERKE
jgi:enoyl-CoA hydratase/carnithine racemase